MLADLSGGCFLSDFYHFVFLDLLINDRRRKKNQKNGKSNRAVRGFCAELKGASPPMMCLFFFLVSGNVHE